MVKAKLLVIVTPAIGVAISGVYRSWRPVPDGPLRNSYAGCLSDHAVRPPAVLINSNTLLILGNWCGATVLVQPAAGSRGSFAGLIAAPAKALQ